MDYEFVYRGEVLPVTNMFDVHGDETNDPDDAETLVAAMPDGQWLAAKVFIGELREAKCRSKPENQNAALSPTSKN